MITAAQLRAARALAGIDQKKLAELSGLSVPTIQRMEASEGVIRGNVDSLMKLVAALDAAGIELIGGVAAVALQARPALSQGAGQLGAVAGSVLGLAAAIEVLVGTTPETATA